ncbi:hypothetical protein ACFQH8_05770 [Halomicroarcula sp. GCM10025710]
MTNGAPAAHADEIRLPGQRSVERDRNATTVTVADDLWAEAQALATDD